VSSPKTASVATWLSTYSPASPPSSATFFSLRSMLGYAGWLWRGKSTKVDDATENSEVGMVFISVEKGRPFPGPSLGRIRGCYGQRWVAL
jgi:hypothetical protein